MRIDLSKGLSKFWLMSMHQSEILYIVTRNLYQNVAAMLAKTSIVTQKKLVKRLKKTRFLWKIQQ